MNAIRRGALPVAINSLKHALQKPHWEPLALAFAKRMDQDPEWQGLPLAQRKSYAQELEPNLVKSANTGNTTALLALNSLSTCDDTQLASLAEKMDFGPLPRSAALRIFAQTSAMSSAGVLSVRLLEKLLEGTEPWVQDDLARLFLGVISLDTSLRSIEIMERCSALLPKGPLMPELAAAVWVLRQSHNFPAVSSVIPDIRFQSVGALSFLRRVLPEMEEQLDVTNEVLKLPQEQFAALCEDPAIWSLAREPQVLVERLATLCADMRREQIAAICMHVLPPRSPTVPTVAYDLLAESLIDSGQVAPLVPLVRNLAKFPLESQAVDNLLPFLLRSAKDERELRPLTLVAFDEFQERHGGDISVLFGLINPADYNIDEVCLSLSVATKFYRREAAASGEVTRQPWRESFFAQHCDRILTLYNTPKEEDSETGGFRPDHWHIVAGAFRLLRGPRLSEQEGKLIDLLGSLTQSRENQLTQGILEEIGRKDPKVDSRLPKERLKQFVVDQAHGFNPGKDRHQQKSSWFSRFFGN